ncbi:thiaminase II [Falsirhodobacter algicola]|uniref:Aminopyrimidine aminohydrolase n=1 Tax=Falsirhodobacter algicola TaxID=2692330 RepID=A0A8J8MUM8_9RHOB|nr:thiaminase II [Falsirhodobacter algicola]QUS37021.1 thiaminase II [Falsirhodobacter algicola]
MTGFTQTLAAATASLNRQIHAMPFNRALADGTLPEATFRGYIVQDAHYLEGFARALALVAAKASDPDAIALLASSAAGAISAERSLHAHYMQLFGVSAEQFAATEVSAACDHYVSYLLRVAAIGNFAEGVAALLPCFWIYRDVGRAIAERAAPGNPYAAWIDTYAGEAFDEGVTRMLALTDRVAAAGDAACRARMQAAFARCCWHEWHFWDSAYHERGWPAP